MTARIYYVTDNAGTEWLVEASSPSQAVRHVTKPYVARVAEQGDLVRLVSAGTKVEKAKE